MKFIKAKNKIYQLKFGLSSFIALEDFSYIPEQEKKIIKFYLALNNSSLTLDDAREIMSQLDCDIDELLDEVMRDSVGGALKETSAASIQEQIEELYSLAVGQMGISPQVFFGLSPHEIELIYIGYIQNKELDANIQLIANKKTNSNNSQLITLFDEECRPSTLAKRKDTFDSLGI